MKTGIELFEYNMRLGVRNQKTGTRHYWVGHLTNGCFGKFGSKLCFCLKKKKVKVYLNFILHSFKHGKECGGTCL